MCVCAGKETLPQIIETETIFVDKCFSGELLVFIEPLMLHEYEIFF